MASSRFLQRTFGELPGRPDREKSKVLFLSVGVTVSHAWLKRLFFLVSASEGVDAEIVPDPSSFSANVRLTLFSCVCASEGDAVDGHQAAPTLVWRPNGIINPRRQGCFWKTRASMQNTC